MIYPAVTEAARKQESIAEQFIAQIKVRFENLVVGDPRESGTQVGPQVTKAQAMKTLSYIEIAKKDGGKVIASAKVPSGADLASGFFVPPTAFVDLPKSSAAVQEEIFGPVLSIATFKDEADAISKAHDSDF